MVSHRAASTLVCHQIQAAHNLPTIYINIYYRPLVFSPSGLVAAVLVGVVEAVAVLALAVVTVAALPLHAAQDTLVRLPNS